MSFAGIYVSTIVLMLTADHFGLFTSDKRSGFSNFPTYESLANFKVEQSSLYLVLFSLFVMTPALAVWRIFVKKFFSVLALEAAGLRKGSKKHEKFVEQAWLALHYILVTSLGYGVLHNKPWWPLVIHESTRAAIIATREERLEDQKDIGLQALISIQLSFYLLELFSLLLLKERRGRSDAVVYFFHHIYTVTLLAGCWLNLDQRIGSTVLFLHDVGDIFLPIGKLFTYSEKHTLETKSRLTYQIVQACGIIFFVIFIITFAIPRIILFGGLIYYGIYELHWIGCCGPVINGACNGCPGQYLTANMVLILGLLWPMHVFWFYLIMRMALKVLSGAYQDVRSDDELAEDSRPKTE